MSSEEKEWNGSENEEDSDSDMELSGKESEGSDEDEEDKEDTEKSDERDEELSNKKKAWLYLVLAGHAAEEYKFYEHKKDMEAERERVDEMKSRLTDTMCKYPEVEETDLIALEMEMIMKSITEDRIIMEGMEGLRKLTRRGLEVAEACDMEVFGYKGQGITELLMLVISKYGYFVRNANWKKLKKWVFRVRGNSGCRRTGNRRRHRRDYI